MIRVYEYSGCSTCKAALKFLDSKKAKYEKIAIVDQPPTKAELKRMLGIVGELKKLFNTSGVQYREMKIAEKLPKMSEDAALELLSKNGKLVKRPFALGPKGGVVGFREEAWSAFFKENSR